jgi:hypothetical protein
MIIIIIIIRRRRRRRRRRRERKYINEPYRIQLESPQSTLTICTHINNILFIYSIKFPQFIKTMGKQVTS